MHPHTEHCPHFPHGSPCLFTGCSPAFGVFWKWHVAQSATGWPEIIVTSDSVDAEDAEHTFVWSAERAVSDKKHTLSTLLNVTMKDRVAPLSETRTSAPGFFGWGVQKPSAVGATGAASGVGGAGDGSGVVSGRARALHSTHSAQPNLLWLDLTAATVVPAFNCGCRWVAGRNCPLDV